MTVPLLPARVALALFGALFFSLQAGLLAAQAGAREGLVGAWQLNFALTSTPPDVEAVAIDERPRPRAGMGGVGGPAGRVGPGRMGGGVDGGAAGSRDRRRVRTLLRRAGDAPAMLTLVLDGARVLLTDRQGRTTTLTTNNRKQEVVTGDGEIDVKARWDGEHLVVEEDFGSRMKIIYRYTGVGQGDARQLRVAVTVEVGSAGRDGRGVPPLTRVYDPATP